MFLLICLLVLSSVYVISNSKISDTHRVGFFVVVGVVLLLWVIFSII